MAESFDDAVVFDVSNVGALSLSPDLETSDSSVDPVDDPLIMHLHGQAPSGGPSARSKRTPRRSAAG